MYTLHFSSSSFNTLLNIVTASQQKTEHNNHYNIYNPPNFKFKWTVNISVMTCYLRAVYWPTGSGIPLVVIISGSKSSKLQESIQRHLINVNTIFRFLLNSP